MKVHNAKLSGYVWGTVTPPVGWNTSWTRDMKCWEAESKMGGRGWEGHTRGLGVTLQPIGTHGFLSVHSAPGSGRVAQSSSSHGPDLAVPGSNRVSQWEARSMRKKILPPSIKIALSQHCSTSRVWAPRGSSKENIQLKL